MTLLRFAVVKMQFPSADFPLTKPCGEIMCQKFYICSAIDHQCHHCNTFCTETDNNYDKEICERNCPGNYYINLLLLRSIYERRTYNVMFYARKWFGSYLQKWTSAPHADFYGYSYHELLCIICQKISYYNHKSNRES